MLKSNINTMVWYLQILKYIITWLYYTKWANHFEHYCISKTHICRPCLFLPPQPRPAPGWRRRRPRPPPGRGQTSASAAQKTRITKFTDGELFLIWNVTNLGFHPYILRFYHSPKRTRGLKWLERKCIVKCVGLDWLILSWLLQCCTLLPK